MTATTIREVTPDDAAAVLDLVVLCDIAEIGEPDYTLEDVEEDLARATQHGWAAVGDGGELAGYCWVERRSNHTSINADVMVRPGGDQKLLPRLLDHALEAARELEPTLSVHVFASSSNHQKCAAFAAAGGRVVRHFWRMAIDLPDSPAPVVPPPAAGVSVRTADGGEDDLRSVHHVIDTAFLDHFGHQSSGYDEWAPTHTTGTWGDHSLWWLATVDGEPAAAAITAARPDPDGYIADLGTLSAYRGRGLGRLLLLTAFAEFRRRGLRKVSLGVDATNPTGAVRLYESVGMNVRHEFTTYEFPAAR